MAEELEQKLAIAKEQEEAMEELKHHKRYQYRDDLHAQLEETQKRKQDEMQRFLEEKRMVDEVVAKILEDDARYVGAVAAMTCC